MDAEACEGIFNTPVFMLSGIRQKAWALCRDWAEALLDKGGEDTHPEVLEYYATPKDGVVGVIPDDVESEVGPEWRHISTIRFDCEGEVVGCLCTGNPKDCPKYLKRGCRINEIH